MPTRTAGGSREALAAPDCPRGPLLKLPGSYATLLRCEPGSQRRLQLDELAKRAAVGLPLDPPRAA
jgi:hypothetical protein